MRRLLATACAATIASTGLVAAALPASAATATSADLLAQLIVEPESNTPAYNRDQFEPWVDATATAATPLEPLR